MTSVHKPNLFKALNHLDSHGWVPLRQMAAILGYAHIPSIYLRQKGNNPIPVIRVGGVNRIYEDEVFKALEDRKEHHQTMVKSIYNSIKIGAEAE